MEGGLILFLATLFDCMCISKGPLDESASYFRNLGSLRAPKGG